MCHAVCDYIFVLFLLLVRKLAVARLVINTEKLVHRAFLPVGVPWCFVRLAVRFGRGCKFVQCAVCHAVAVRFGLWLPERAPACKPEP